MVRSTLRLVTMAESAGEGRDPRVVFYKEEDFDHFKKDLIDGNRGRQLLLFKITSIAGQSVDSFLAVLSGEIDALKSSLRLREDFTFYAYGQENQLYVGASPGQDFFLENANAFYAILGRLHDTFRVSGQGCFEFGIGRTQANYISDREEIFQELDLHAENNLEDNIRRWNWTSLNRVNNYFAVQEMDAVIQPIVFYDTRKKSFSIRGGEVFIGGRQYEGYDALFKDIPGIQDRNRIDLLILEKLLASCSGVPGLLKFNITPQALIDTFDTDEKVGRFRSLLEKSKLKPQNIRLELVEKPYEETGQTLREVCERFYALGVSFAADDFGMRSQSHHLVLALGDLIKEFKLDPISFKFRIDQDHIRLLDNLAFIQYCKHLANNRDAMITAEALEDVEDLKVLIGHQVYYYQANMFCGKIPLKEYTANYLRWQHMPGSILHQMLHNPEIFAQVQEKRNIFAVAESLGLWNPGELKPGA